MKNSATSREIGILEGKGMMGRAISANDRYLIYRDVSYPCLYCVNYTEQSSAREILPA